MTDLLRDLSVTSSGLREGVTLLRLIVVTGEDECGEGEGLRPVGLPCSSRSSANMAAPADATVIDFGVFWY